MSRITLKHALINTAVLEADLLTSPRLLGIQDHGFIAPDRQHGARAAVSWKSAISGNWSTAADWSTGTVPGSGSTVTVSVAGTYTVTISSTQAAGSLTLNNVNATVSDSGTFTVGGALAVTAGTFTLASGGDVVGATVSTGANGSFVASGGTLSGVTYEGTLNLGQNDASLTLSNGFTLTGAGGTGAGVINLTGYDAQLIVEGSQTLSNGMLDLTSSDDRYDSLSLSNTNSASETLTLAANFSVIDEGYEDSITGGSLNDVLVNQGGITAGEDGEFQVGSGFGTFTNAGGISVSNGGQMYIDATNFTNAGTISVSGSYTSLDANPSSSFVNTGTINVVGTGTANINDATIGASGTWTNQGVIMVSNGGEATLEGSFSLATLNSINDSGGFETIAGTLQNNGTLSITQSLTLGSNAQTLTGTISGGTVNDAGGYLYFNGGTLSGVTYAGTLNLDQNSESVALSNGSTLTGAGGTGASVINLTGYEDYLTIEGSQTLSNGVLNLGDENDDLTLSNTNNASETLTLAANFSVIDEGYEDSITGGSLNDVLVNQGGITAGEDGEFQVGSGFGTFTNAGGISVSNGGQMYIDATNFTNAGTISVSGSYTSLDANPSSSFVNTGTINVVGTGTANINDATIGASGTWTNQGVIMVSNGGEATLEGSFSLATLNSINDAGGFETIAGTLQNNGTLSITQSLTLGSNGQTLTGTISGGTVNDAGGYLYFNGGTLSGVTYAGTLNLDQNSESVALSNGSTLTGAGGTGASVINLTGYEDYLTIEGSQTLSNGVLNLGDENDDLTLSNTNSASETLTLAANFSVIDEGYEDSITGGSLNDVLVNQGGITAGEDGEFQVGSGFGTFTNAGGISVSNGGQMYIDATNFTNAGTISVSGSYTTLYANPSSSFVNTGTINVVGTGTVNLTNAFIGASGTWTNQGVIMVSNGGEATLDGSFSLATLNSINDSGGFETIAGTLQNNGTLAITQSLTLGSNAQTLTGTISGGTVNDAGGYLYFNGGTLSGVTYEGTLNLGQNDASLTLSNGFTLTGAGGTGAGVINLTGYDAQLIVEGSQTLSNGMLDLTSSDDRYDSLSLSNTNSASETLTLAANFSVIDEGYGDSISGGSSNDALVNQGTITGVGDGDFQVGSGFGTFTNAGGISVSNGGQMYIYATNFTNAGTISVSGSYTGLIVNPSSGFTNTGELIVSNAATLTIDSASFGSLKSGTLSGSYEVDGNSLLQLGNNEFTTTIAGTVTLNGTGSTIESLKTTHNVQTAIDTSLTTINAGGVLNLLGGRGMSSTNSFSDNGLLTIAGGSFTETSLAIGSTGTLSGNGTINVAVTDGGTILATGGTLKLADAVSGAGALQIGAGATLEAGAATAAQETTTFNGVGATLKLDAPASFASVLKNYAPGDVIDVAKTTLTSVSSSGTTLLAVSASGTTTLTLAAALANEHLTLSTDNAGGTDITAYGYAQASTASPSPLAFGNHHVGDTVSQALSLTNAAAANGYYEALDATLGGASGAITASGSIALLGAGQTNASSLVIGLNTSTTGSIAGSAVITLFTDGTGVDGYGQTSLGSQTVNVTGAVYAYAQATEANNGTLVLANTHVGQSVSGTVGVTNSAAANGYSEALDASIATASTGFSASGSFTGLAAGATNAGSLLVSYLASAGGDYSGSATLGLVSDGTGIDGLGTTTLAGQTVVVTGAAYAYAVAQAGTTTINFGVTHVGSTDSTAISLLNAAAANGFSEALDASWGTATGAVVSGTLTGLAAGATNASSLLIGLATSASGSFSGTALLDLLSDGTGIDGLGTTALAGETFTVTGTVDNYAVAAFQDPGGPAITGSSTSETINLGSVQSGNPALTLSLGVLNSATGLSDLLQGTIATSGSTAGFIDSGFGTFSGLGAGQGEKSQSVTLTTGTAGTFTETVLLSSFGTNASGYDGALATETLTITGTVTPAGSTSYTLAVGPNNITGANGGDLFIAVAGSLNSRDYLTGGTGANTLSLIGAGLFDVNSLAVFSNIQTITATEGQAASGSVAATAQTLLLKDGETETINVASATAVKGDSNPVGITIYGDTGTDTINLATGVDKVNLSTGMDTITLGGAKNVIAAGGGTAIIDTIAANAAASITGTTTGSTTLNITNAGTVTLNAADTYLTVDLAAGSKLTLGALGFITANGGAGTDTIIAGAGNDVLIGGTGDALTGFASGGDTFYGASAALNGDKITNWTSGDMIDLTDMNNATLHALMYHTSGSAGTLTVADGTHTSAIVFESKTLSLSDFTVIGPDGHGGTLIGY